LISKIKKIIQELHEILDKKWIISDRQLMKDYLKDETAKPVCPTASANVILVKPINSNEVSAILKIANRKKIPVFPVGGRTGLVGGSIPIEPGIMLSLERMKKIKIDKENMMAIVDAGVTLEELINAVEDVGLSFPLHPGDEGAQVGGLIATNAGGVRAIKYGVIRDYIKGLEVVLSTGEILNLGGKLLKNNTGYNILHLLIGSEGTLGIITKGIIKLHPENKFSATLIVAFSKRRSALQTVPLILKSGMTPLAIEYVEKEEIEKTEEHLHEKWPCDKGKSQLIIIFSSTNEDLLYSMCVKISEICQTNGSFEPIIAETKSEQARILRIRSNMYTAIKSDIYDILDITVPPNQLEQLMDYVDEIASKFNTRIPIYGHAGDGNLHVHLIKEERKTVEHFEKIKRDIYTSSVELGGVITGEHGIGRIRIKDLSLVLSDKEIELLQAIKKVFDPNNILNPGKVILSSNNS
jgi:glycolate oxidase